VLPPPLKLLPPPPLLLLLVLLLSRKVVRWWLPTLPALLPRGVWRWRWRCCSEAGRVVAAEAGRISFAATAAQLSRAAAGVARGRRLLPSSRSKPPVLLPKIV
jgi:hypothetical protein